MDLYFSFRIALLFSFLASVTNAQTLDELRWENRIILVFSPTPHAPIGVEQMQLLNEQQADLKDRDLVIFRLSPNNGISPNHQELTNDALSTLYQKYAVSTSSFTLILIGKDGGEKFRSKKLTPPQILFDLIDGMPMRRSEMRRKKKG